MFWILRRTKLTSAAALLNTLNNNNSENRPARKNYNKLTGEDVSRLKSDHLDNVAECKDQGCTTHDPNNDTDTDSDFTDIELDDRDDFSDDSDYDEALTCNVCDRTFSCPKQLSSHKQKKRHFGCSACDSLFPSLMALEHHKEEFEHWSGDEDLCTDSEDDDETVISEECERLL
ncbi:uncharacterized protein LOC103314906 [Tribolium castaneum]|uniref:C2H2-type domain-containing protein n=1 Tax=Tribolium castaneum TaxID=7070 RepID=D7EJW3_TRICA|nr:PREDICTED: uncharacterized protein LOC103314906 [Tribolium castaneum]EFA12877.2 hypothetical protein TcasGA2_TC011555 [Tribolium castaneum]|eukprot:XP_015839995.1 PREDICTED: uncharacterized protein LOC103314906 [Tribolium castaneum]